jgi:predicted nuclease of restriction endonuclease-like (RecB) superfamily
MGLPVDDPLPADYGELLERLKAEIAGARVRAALKVNEEQIALYWRIGREILDRQEREGWGAKVVERLAADLKQAFPEMKGLSRTNLMRMRAFAAAWPEVVPRAVGRLPWGHNSDLLDKLDDPAQRLWYAEQAVEQGWTRQLLQHHLATQLIDRRGEAISNFAERLPAQRAELAQQITRDPYHFDFLALSEDARERDVEAALLGDLRRFMQELGAGFAFMDNQVRFEVDGEEFFIDLLFFHVELNCYVVIELKLGKFRPEHAGQLNFYVNVVDAQLRRAHHNPTIGLVLCATRKETVARYTLQGMERPIGVSAYATGPAASKAPLPGLPSPAQLAQGVSEIVARHADDVETVTAEIVDD